MSTKWYGQPAYGMTRQLAGASPEDASARIRAALQKEGFGILTEIDVRATFDKKLGQPFRPYLILGACNPNLALRALTVEPGVGLLLPCNVVVTDDEGGAVVSIADPVAMAKGIEAPGLDAVAVEARDRLARALAAA